MRKPVDPKPEAEVDRSDNKEFWLEVSRRKPPDSKLGTPIYHKFGWIMGHRRPSDGKTEFFHPIWANRHNGYLAPYYEEAKPKQPSGRRPDNWEAQQVATDPEPRLKKVEELKEDGAGPLDIVGLETDTLLPKRVAFSDPAVRAAWLMSGAFQGQLAKELAQVHGKVPTKSNVAAKDKEPMIRWFIANGYKRPDHDMILDLGTKAADAIAAQMAWMSANNMDHVDTIEIDMALSSDEKGVEDVAEPGGDGGDGGRTVAGEAAGEVRRTDEDEGDRPGDGEGGVPAADVREGGGESSAGSVQDGEEARPEPAEPAPDSGPDQVGVPGPGRDVSSGGSD